jgi:hypothetical protein
LHQTSGSPVPSSDTRRTVITGPPDFSRTSSPGLKRSNIPASRTSDNVRIVEHVHRKSWSPPLEVVRVAGDDLTVRWMSHGHLQMMTAPAACFTPERDWLSGAEASRAGEAHGPAQDGPKL